MDLGMECLSLPVCCLKDVIGFGASCLDYVPGLRAIVAVVLICFIPGFAWSFVFFTSEQVNKLERFVLSIALSIAMVTLSMFALNLGFDVKVTGSNAVINIIVITLLAVAFYFTRKHFKPAKLRGSK